MGTHEIISEKTLYQGWSTLLEYELEIQSDKLGTHVVKREIYDSGDGAAALLINPRTQKVILIRQYRLAAHLNGHQDGMLIEVCAGLLDGKDPQETIRKEILEETGILTNKLVNIGSSYATPGAHKELIHLFIAFYEDEDRVSEGGGLREEHEEIEILELTFSEITDLVKNGQIQDSKTLILVQHAMISLYIPLPS